MNMDSPPKIFIENPAAGGIDINAICSHDGCSNYFLGSYLNLTSTPYANLNPQNTVNMIIDTWQSRGLADLSIAAGSQGNLIFAGTRNHVIFKTGVNDRKEAANVCLQLILELIQGEMTCVWNKEIDPLYDLVSDLDAFNRKICKQLNVGKNKLYLGESFTGGALTEVMMSTNSEALNGSLVWYDARLKQFLGVPENLLQPSTIVSRESISMATLALLNQAPITSTIAIGTTGFANISEENKSDYFCIGLSARDVKTESWQFEVTYSKDIPRCSGKRQLTRYLGVTASLYALAYHLKDYVLKKELAEQISKYTIQM